MARLVFGRINRLTQEWWDLGSSSHTRALPKDYEPTDPFKPRLAPLRSLPNCQGPVWIKPDPMHTYALGWGKDMVASTVLLLTEMGVWGWGKFQKRLDRAFSSFRSYCRQAGKSTSLTTFCLKTFKVNGWLAFTTT